MDGTIPLLGSLHELKGAFGFVLYVDEAHSFGSIGKTGKGILELWNDEHPSDTVPLDLIDVRAGSLSKAVGSLGGFVCASSKRFDRALQNRWEDSQQREGGTLATSAILQTLSFLAQPKRMQENLLRLKDISTFCHDELKRQGIFVYGDEELSHLPILPIFGGRPSKAAKLSFVLRKCGVAAAPVSTPAVDIWESRVRVTLSPSYTDTDVNNLITAIITASRQIGLGKPCHIPRCIYYSTKKVGADDVVDENIQALQDLSTLVDRQADQTCTDKAFKFLDQTVIDAGSAAQQQYGIGSGAARWVLGTFQPHLNVEGKIAQLVDQPSALTYPSADLGLMSTIAALCRPIIGTKNHYFLIPANVSKSVEEGLRAASTKSRTVAIRYTDVESLVPLFVALAGRRDTYISLYIQLYQNGHYIDLAQLANRLHNELPRSHRRFTILLDDSQGASLHGSQTLRISRRVDFGRIRDLLSAQILITGCFMNDVGLPGGWLAGSSELIEEFRLTSRGYMFSTSPMPFIMAMIEQSLLSLL
jgi:serine palmitoyltransferase